MDGSLVPVNQTSEKRPQGRSRGGAGDGNAALASATGTGIAAYGNEEQLVTFRVGRQLFGLNCGQVQDIHKIHSITKVPLADNEIAGIMNIRGKIVTAIDLRRRLGVPDRVRSEAPLSINVEFRGIVYSMIIDEIGDVLSIDTNQLEKNPPTITGVWRATCEGVYRLDKELLIVTSVDKMLGPLLAAHAS